MGPIEIALLVLAGALAALILVVLVRTLSFKPKAQCQIDTDTVEFDKEKVVSNLQDLVRCKTVSKYSHDDEDNSEFEKFLSILPKLYPNVYKNCEFKQFDDRALLYKWQGKSHDNPSVLMAHYDVVPVDEGAWERDPFGAEVVDGVMWGRGTLDTKVTFGSALFATDKLIADGFVPENDVYLAFSGGEEVNGNGAVHIVEYFKENGITPELVLDEGGAVVENVFPGVKAPCGLIGIAEKGMLDLEYKVKSNGGHASAPKPHTPVGVLSQACCKVEANPFKRHLTKPVAEMFDTLGRHSTFLYRMIFANMWLFSGVLDMICKKSGGELNALMRTTVAFTQMSGSNASNVIPPEATMVSNMRLNPCDTMDSAIEYIKSTIDDESITLTALRGMNPSNISRTDVTGYKKVERAIASTWRGTIVSPYLMVQCSDSRHWSKISDKVYRFSAMDLTSDERKTIHGHNERIRLECLYHATEFYLRLIKNL